MPIGYIASKLARLRSLVFHTISGKEDASLIIVALKTDAVQKALC